MEEIVSTEPFTGEKCRKKCTEVEYDLLAVKPELLKQYPHRHPPESQGAFLVSSTPIEPHVGKVIGRKRGTGEGYRQSGTAETSAA